MIQDIAPKVYDNHYDPEKVPGPGAYVIFCRDRKLFCRTGMGTLEFPAYGALEDRSGVFRYLFSIDGEEFWLALTEDGAMQAPPAEKGRRSGRGAPGFLLALRRGKEGWISFPGTLRGRFAQDCLASGMTTW